MRRYAEAAEECKQMGAEATGFEVKFFLAQLPWLLHADAYQTMLHLKALAQSWPSEGAAQDRLELLQVLSHLSLVVGHGRLAAEELQRALAEGDCRQLWSLLGRHHLSAGNLPASDAAFAKAQAVPGQESTVLLNSGLRAMALGDFEAGRDSFEAAAAALHADEGSQPQEVLAAENNLAVCKFYTKDLRGACEGLKALVSRDPVRFLVPCLLQNLASFYEFAQDAASQRKILRDLAGAAQLEDLEPRLFQAPQT
ncbi:ABCC1 [Symbiodinium sp. KB8]|nr:ABCC1 [Symbiodinium sp. KB8]